MPSKSPNMFLAIQISSPDLKKNLRKVHFNCVVKDYRLKDFITPLETAHVTLNVFRVEKTRLEEAKLILRDAFENRSEELKSEGRIAFKGLGMFGKSVLFAKPNKGNMFLQKLHEMFQAALACHNIGVSEYQSYTPHLTLLQMNGARENDLREIPRECFQVH